MVLSKFLGRFLKAQVIKVSPIILVFIFCSSILHAQDPLLIKADEYYRSFAYGKAILLYKKILKKKESTPELLAKIANAYYFNTNFGDAEHYYRKLITVDTVIDPELYFRYAHTLKSVMKYEEANSWMDVFAASKPRDSRTKLYKKSLDYLLEIKKRSGRYTIDCLDFNTSHNDFGPSFNKDLLIFATGINSDGSRGKLSNSQQDAGFFDLYAIPLDSKGAPKGNKAYPLVGDVNTRFHESTAAFTKDGKTMYFTRNNYFKGKKGKTKDGITLLKIYKATNEHGQWVDIEELPFNSDEFSVAHPALSPDEKRLYFAYSGPGSLGLSDIFYVDILDENSFSEPKSLGSKINTDGRESFPYVTESNLLFFASNGKQGLGALDVYVADLSSMEKSYFDAFNIGAPINSEKDDFAFVLDEKRNKGFFSSNRDGGVGEDDIYGFTREEEFNIKCAGIIKGVAKKANDFVLLSDTTIVLLDVNGNEIQRVTSDSKGNFTFDIEECRDDVLFNVKAMMGNERDSEIEDLMYEKGNRDKIKTLYFSFPKKKPIEEASLSVTRLFDFDPIYFKFGSARIGHDQSDALLKVIYFLREHPEFNVQIESHADSRSGDEFNQKLSERRGQKTRRYLINWKIDPSRITFKGYGETKLTNQCTNDVRCSEYEHRQNRRSEFLFFEKE